MKSFLNVLSSLLGPLFLMGLCSFVSLGHAQKSNQKEQPLKFAAIFIEEPPYIYLDKASDYQGIIPEIAKALSRELNLKLDYLPTSRKGLEAAIKSEKADVTWLSASWVNDAEQFAFSDTVLLHKEYLHSLSPFKAEGSTLDWVKGKTICIRQDYQYPILEEFFEQDHAQAVRVSNQVPLLTLLAKKRCDLLYMNNYRAEWMLKKLSIKPPIFLAPQPLHETNLAFMFNKNWRSKMPQINQALNKIKDSGELSAIVQKQLRPEP